MDDLKRFSQAVLSGVQGAQSAPPIAGISSEVNNAFASQLRAPLVSMGAGAGNIAGQVASDEEAARKAEQQRKLRELENMADPSKYERRRKEDGGFSFHDPSGKEIDINTYAMRTGMKRADAIQDSENPVDIQYMNDYANMEKLMKSAFDGDTETVNSILDLNGLSRNTKPQDYAQELIRRYPHIYGAGSYDVSRRNLNRPIFKQPTESAGGLDIDALMQMAQQRRQGM